MAYWEDELRRRGAEYYANIKDQTEGGRKARRVSRSNEALFKDFAEAQKEITKLVEFQEGIIKKIGKTKAAVELAEPEAKLVKDVQHFLKDKLEAAIYVPDKMKMKHNLIDLKTKFLAFLQEKSYTEAQLVTADSLFEEEINYDF